MILKHLYRLKYITLMILNFPETGTPHRKTAVAEIRFRPPMTADSIHSACSGRNFSRVNSSNVENTFSAAAGKKIWISPGGNFEGAAQLIDLIGHPELFLIRDFIPPGGKRNCATSSPPSADDSYGRGAAKNVFSSKFPPVHETGTP